MHELRLAIASALIAMSFAACRAEKTEEIGPVKDCGNGQHFNLETGDCRILAGHQFLLDSLGFERIALKNGMTVPRRINGKNAFSISFTYDVTKRTKFDVVLKRVEYKQMLGDNFSDWANVYVPAGRGTASVKLYPKDKKPIADGKAANYVEDQWIDDSGYAVELKGGDRYENDDSDGIRDWRVAGIEVSAEAPDDPDGKTFILGDMKAGDTVKSCGMVEGMVDVIKTDIDLVLAIGLKEPKKNWDSWGGVELKVAAGAKGSVPFRFKAAKAEDDCPAPGEKVQLDPWVADWGQYLIKLDAYDTGGKKLSFDDENNKAGINAIGARVVARDARALEL